MKRKTILTVIAILLAIGIFYVEFFLDYEEIKVEVSKGQKPKAETILDFLPTSTTDQIVHHNYYSLSYHEKHEQAEWVAYELRKDQLINSNFKRPYFQIDKSVKTGAASWRNYKNSGYDRGHLCAAADREFSIEAFNETFLTSNITPQEHNFNSRLWNRLEQKTRYWARKYDGVYVITAGVLEDNLPSIGNENVSVPRYFYKIILDHDANPQRAIAFLMPHKDSNKPLYDFVVSIDKIEELTNIDFFPKLDDDLEDRLEADTDYKDWSF